MADCSTSFSANGEWVFFQTLEGEKGGRKGDVIVKKIAGEFYLCAPDIFAATYEKVGFVDTRNGCAPGVNDDRYADLAEAYRTRTAKP